MRLPIAPYGWREIGFAALGTVAAAGVGAALVPLAGPAPALGLGALGLVALGFVLSFFRDPERMPPPEPGLVSPADGTVTEVAEVDEPTFVSGRAWKVGIFLSVFNCHVNRAPAAGVVRLVRHTPGRYLDARDPASSRENESNAVGIESPEGRLLVRQVSGAIARRIVCSVGPGRAVARGERIGMIKFGSRTELFVPLAAGYAPAVRPGDRVKGGLTILARPAGDVAPAAPSSPLGARRTA
ncbi:MAG: phosphatidylserine decarboxylase [Planctomycetales bacterium]|nr:phosphatidylserine decarboxylase [Planctomycetales bacterium]